MPALVMSVNGTNISHYILEKSTITIGRDSDNDITIDDPAVSSRHAIISRLSTDEYEIIDKASTNGTFINNKKIQQQRLNNNDFIGIGMTTFTFQAHEETPLEQTKKIKKSWIPGIYYLRDK